MKKLILFICTVVLVGSVMIGLEAQTYVKVTEDNTVSAKEDVVVQETKSTETVTQYSLTSIDKDIAQIDAQIAYLQAKRAELVTLRAAVSTEADKVVLK